MARDDMTRPASFGDIGIGRRLEMTPLDFQTSVSPVRVFGGRKQEFHNQPSNDINKAY